MTKSSPELSHKPPKTRTPLCPQIPSQTRLWTLGRSPFRPATRQINCHLLIITTILYDRNAPEHATLPALQRSHHNGYQVGRHGNLVTEFTQQKTVMNPNTSVTARKTNWDFLTVCLNLYTILLLSWGSAVCPSLTALIKATRSWGTDTWGTERHSHV